jgi:hypothetical protein
MEKIYKTWHVYGDRPTRTPQEDAIPANALIFNGPRPLLATEITCAEESSPGHPRYHYLEWTGNFRHGIFYAGVDPADAHAIKYNVEMDGWVLEYHNDSEIIQWGKSYCKQHNIDPTVFEFKDFLESFLNQANKDKR